MRTAYANARLYTGDAVIEKGSFLVQNDVIVSVSDKNIAHGADRTVDLQGRAVAPAFIDLQVYGGNGKLFNNEPTVESIRATWEAVRKGGTAHFQITLSCSPLETMWRAIDACREYWRTGGEGLLGLHLEGPYFNPEKRGAHPLEHIRKAAPSEVAHLIERGRGVVRYMTLAPEMVDDASLKLLLDSGILLSAGHSNATFQQAKAGFAKGIDRATHLFNAMSAFQSREPGMVGAIYDAKPWASVIADGVHCDYNALKISKEILKEKLFLITDAVTESRAGDYRFRFAGDRFVDDNGTLAGSSLSMWQAVLNAFRYAGIPLEEALRMAALYPATVVGEDKRWGRIAPGYEASLLSFDYHRLTKNIVDAERDDAGVVFLPD
jgi:N-acetylglucosamine-6-phosphate deacetylase